MVLMVLFALAMFGLSRITPRFPMPGSVRNTLLAMIFAPGALCIACGILEFRRRKTTVDPRYPEKASILVCSGIYRYTRNPMYVGALLLLLATAIAVQAPATLIFLPLFVWHMNAFQIRPEEEMLLAKFGEPYGDYMRKVRRWV
ncbi:MAG TPA: isoprenylcysteine carboxylmethyltransferase family protein [Fibrobacteria bacterium]|nr:isoprenylcysteine carboxylmethyltransferase family protein [Fibrobacteria bacterium]